MTTPVSDIQDLKGTTYTMADTKSVIAALNEHAMYFNFAVASARTEKQRKIAVICVHGGKNRNTHKVTPENRIRKTMSKKSDCPWKMLLKWSKKKNVWTVNKVSPLEEHNHPLDKKPDFYHQHRKLNEQRRQRAASKTTSTTEPTPIQNPLLREQQWDLKKTEI
ncbi:hypothetical protein BCR43DRAFT_484652 [Syncephalastrum racemosum]|uniref:FAR1 domain-containing protein n=1 Tax=Syncephalastrum racemosum TaxID=13706 RepID=A0A1X2HL79_SYNRA|nr:hypothetical protein BCR43DRAFT_484652 [Syncephalastrum racemosum]